MSQTVESYPAEVLETQTRSLRFYDELWIDCRPTEVWSYFSDLTQWRSWSPICRACTTESRELQLGRVLNITFSILGLNITVAATIIRFEPPELITWRGRKFGVTAIHTYRFLPRSNGTLMCNEETFSGLGSPSRALIKAWYRRNKLSSRSLQGIARELFKRDAVDDKHEKESIDCRLQVR